MPSVNLKQLKDLLIDTTIQITGLDTQHVLNAYQPDSAPFNEQAVNAAYLYVYQIDSNTDKATYTALTPNTPQAGIATQYYTRMFQCKWTLYGPDSFDLADSIRNAMMTEAVREPLSVQGVFPVVGIQAPTRMPEQINNQWWERSDLKINLSVYTEHSADQPYFSSASVGIKESGGDSELIIIQP